MKLKSYLMIMRPPLLVLGILASAALLSWTDRLLTIRGFLVILSVVFVNNAGNVMNEFRDAKDDIHKKGKKVYANRFSDSLLYGTIGISMIIGVISILLLGFLYSIIYLVVGAVGIGGLLVYNYLRRRDLIGNLAMGVVYGCAAMFAVYPYHLLFPIAFALLAIGFNIQVAIQDSPFDRVYTIVDQLGERESLILSFGLGSVSVVLFYFSQPVFLIPLCLMLVGSPVYWIMENRDVFEWTNRIFGRLTLMIAFIYMLLMG